MESQSLSIMVQLQQYTAVMDSVRMLQWPWEVDKKLLVGLWVNRAVEVGDMQHELVGAVRVGKWELASVDLDSYQVVWEWLWRGQKKMAPGT